MIILHFLGQNSLLDSCSFNLPIHRARLRQTAEHDVISTFMFGILLVSSSLCSQPALCSQSLFLFHAHKSSRR